MKYFSKYSVYPPTTPIKTFSIQNGSFRSNEAPDQSTPRGLLITPRQGDMEIRLYCMLAYVGNGKVIIGEC